MKEITLEQWHNKLGTHRFDEANAMFLKDYEFCREHFFIAERNVTIYSRDFIGKMKEGLIGKEKP